MSHCATSTFDNHFDYRLTVFEDIQSTSTVNVSWNDVYVFELDGVVQVYLGSLQRLSPELSLRCSILFGTE